MKRIVCIALACSALALSSAQAADVVVGGQPMLPGKTIVANALNSADHTTLVAAVKAAGLVDTLQSKGPFTVFAPTNAAFGKLPAGTVDTLVKPENKATLTKILTYHVVPGKLDFDALAAQIKKAARGRTHHRQRRQAVVMMNGKHNIMLKDERAASPISAPMMSTSPTA